MYRHARTTARDDPVANGIPEGNHLTGARNPKLGAKGCDALGRVLCECQRQACSLRQGQIIGGMAFRDEGGNGTLVGMREALHCFLPLLSVLMCWEPIFTPAAVEYIVDILHVKN